MAHAIFNAILGVPILLLIFPNCYCSRFDYSDTGGTTLNDLHHLIKMRFQELEDVHQSLSDNFAEFHQQLEDMNQRQEFVSHTLEAMNERQNAMDERRLNGIFELQDGLRHLQEEMKAQSTQQCSSKNELLDLEVLVRTDECTSGSHNCSYRASCENNLVGYTCNCLNGYSGDGFICEEKCWSPESSQFVGIFGGHDAVQYQFPYMVALDIEFDNTEVQNCGGTILSDTWILTAGHCLQKEGKKVTNMIVRYDGVARDRMRIISNIANYFVHPRYRYDPITEALYDDIALIQLNVPLYHQVSPGVMPICYAKNNAADYYGKVTATGWGLNSYQVPPNVLQFTNLDMITTQMCITGFPGLVQLDKKLCTYTHETGTWKGDSGGPIVAQVSPGSYVQIGIVSYGNAARPDLYPDVYTKVSPYAYWICRTSLIC